MKTPVFFFRLCVALWFCVIPSMRLSAAGLPAEILARLGAEEYAVRQKAEADLLDWAGKHRDLAIRELIRQSKTSEEPEIRERCLSVLKSLSLEDYLKTGEGYVGVLMQDEIVKVPGDGDARSAIRVGQVIEGTAGHQAGLRFNDLIVGVDGEVWKQGRASLPFSEKIKKMKPGTKVTLKVLRDAELMDVVVRLGKRPAGVGPQFFGQMMDLDAAEKAAKEAFFRQWIEAKDTSAKPKP